MNNSQCSFCNTFSLNRIHSFKEEIEIKKIEENLTLFGTSDDPFHAVFFNYFCEKCYSIYEIGHHFNSERDSYSLECLSHSNSEHIRNDAYDRLSQWIIREQRAKNLSQEFNGKKGERVTVFHVVGQLLHDDLKRIQSIGYDKKKELYPYRSKLYISLSDFFENSHFGYQFFEHLTILVFDVDYESLEVYSDHEQSQIYIYSNEIVPFSKMRRYDIEKEQIEKIPLDYSPILSQQVYQKWKNEHEKHEAEALVSLKKKQKEILNKILKKEG